MEERSRRDRRPPRRENPEPARLGDVLAELLAQYEVRYPGLRTTLVETTPAAA